jgi:hypothetical protein
LRFVVLGIALLDLGTIALGSVVIDALIAALGEGGRSCPLGAAEASGAPFHRERTQIYDQRYLQHFPVGGEVVIVDRSWYYRAGVQ